MLFGIKTSSQQDGSFGKQKWRIKSKLKGKKIVDFSVRTYRKGKNKIKGKARSFTKVIQKKNEKIYSRDK